MAIVGSDIFTNGNATGLDTSQIVSPIWMFSTPVIAIILPTVAESISTLFNPSNSNTLFILTFSWLSG